ncbi:MAG: DUF3786 domain-containing protein [Nitrospirae bacterium]|nr:MAG: DUF3786 domain-containing protein [Nitrospirota bacterium]
MIDIYKKLPGTNCGKCGVSTCMAFAVKVKKAQARLEDCPFAKGETPGEPVSQQAATAFSNYEQVSDNLEKEAVKAEFRDIAEAVGGEYILHDGSESVKLRMLTRHYELRKDGLFMDGQYCSHAWTKIIICDYVRRQGRKPLTGEWIALGNFPHTASHVKAFQSNAEKKITGTFKKDFEGLKRRCANMGGIEIEGKIKADYTGRFDLLPNVPLYLLFWKADEEFDPDCKILFDSGAEDHIDIEYLAYLLEIFVKELTGEA